MKILWLTPLFPFPPFSGGQTRAYNLIKNLAKKNEITLFSFIRPGRIQGPIDKLKKFCVKIKTFPGRKTWSLRNILLAGFSHLPFAVTHFYGESKVEDVLREELKREKYDLVHFESFYTSPYLKCAVCLPSVMGNENVEYLIYQRFADQKKFFLLRLMLFWDVWKMKYYEQNTWRKADLNLAVSQFDAEKIEAITKKKCLVIPNGVELESFKKINRLPGKRPRLLFVGDFKYFTNQDAIEFLVKEIWPMIKRELPEAKLRLVGKNPNSFIKSLATTDIIVDSQVDDIRKAYSDADIMIAPMRIASGTNIKILESMASALPVVTTTIGIEGIETQGGKEAIIANKPPDFAREVVSLLRNKKQQQQMGQAGRKLIECFYDWPKISQKLEEGYRELIYGKKN